MEKRNTEKWFRYGSWWRRLFQNRRYKDVLFRRIFQDKKDLLELYNALNGSTYTDFEALEVVTLEDVIFMKMKNDLSFIIGSSINLYEHQSSWNPNMPLRGLIYFARQFEGLISSRGDDLYGKKAIEIPTPVYIVFYNGRGMDTDNVMIYLSDSFSAGRGSGCLECTCIERGILKDILVREKAEVLHMLLTEYDEKKHLRNTYREGVEAGYEKRLREQVQKKLSKGKTIPVIAEELEEDTHIIEQIVASITAC